MLHHCDVISRLVDQATWLKIDMSLRSLNSLRRELSSADHHIRFVSSFIRITYNVLFSLLR